MDYLLIVCANLKNLTQGAYSIHYVRFNNIEYMSKLLAGIPLNELPIDSIAEIIEIYGPDGTPADPACSAAGLEIRNSKEAIDVIKKALKNPSSLIYSKGIPEDIPIYEFYYNRQAVKL